MMLARAPWAEWEWFHGRRVEAQLLRLDDELRADEPSNSDDIGFHGAACGGDVDLPGS